MDCHARPKCFVPVGRPARRPVIDGLCFYREWTVSRCVIPVDFDDSGIGRGPSDNRTIAKRRHDFRIETVDKPVKRRRVQMVIMIVADQNEINGRQGIEGNARRAHALWSSHLERACAVRPDRVGQDIHAGCLDEDADMANHRELNAVAFDSFRRRWL